MIKQSRAFVSLLALCLSGNVIAQTQVHAGSDEAAPPRLLVMDLQANGVDSGTVKTVQGLLVDTIAAQKTYDVLSGNDIRRVLEAEANKALLGCSDDSCMAEVAGAMGAERVVYGSLGKLGDMYVVQLALFDSTEVKVLRRANIKEPELTQIPDRLPALVTRLLKVNSTSSVAADVSTISPDDPALGGANPDAKTDTAGNAISWPRMALLSAGGLGIAAGLGLGAMAVFIGYLPLQQSLQDIAEAEADNDLDGAATAQDDADQQSSDLFLFGGLGAGVVLLGVVGVVAGFIWSEDEATEAGATVVPSAEAQR